VYGPRHVVRAGVIPERVVTSAEHYEPAMAGVATPGGPAPVVGFDVVRGGDGRLRVLEDNLRTPSGFAYAVAARRVADAQLPAGCRMPRASIDPCFGRLAAALRAAAPDGRGDPYVVLLSDGPSNSAWYEHVTVARRLAIPVVGPQDLRSRDGRLYVALPSGRLREVHVVYRRTDEDQLRDEGGRTTWLADTLFDPVRRGSCAVVNAFGNGVADDKLVHAYVEDMIRFYLDEQPLVESVRTYDLGRPEQLTRVLGRLGALVVKPRAGHGGHGVVIGPRCSPDERARVAAAIRAAPDRFVAQETVALSRHPTVCGGRLAPRHVDLRAFAFGTGGQVTVVPGGLTRVALGEGELVVNSSRNGGGKDTWVVG
jgi:carboxylate-amine ligase